MSVENPQNTNSEENAVKPCNGESQPINGLSNGHVEMNGSSSYEKSSSSKHKSSSKDKYRDKDREKDRDRDKDRDKNTKSSSSKESSKTSSKDKYRDKERDKDRDKERDKDRDKDREKNRDKERDKDRDKDREKNRENRDGKDKSSSDKDKYKVSSSSDKHKSSSSSSKDKDRDRDKDKERDKNRDKDKDKERSSNKEKDREKDKEKSSRDKDRSSKDEKPKESSDKERSSKDHKSSTKDKDRSSDKEKSKSEKDKDKDRYKSSSSKDKHSSSGSSKSKDKDKERDREKDKDRKDKDKDRKDRDKDKEKRREKEAKSSKPISVVENPEMKIENGYSSNSAAEQQMISNCNFNGINEMNEDFVKENNTDHVKVKNEPVKQEPINDINLKPEILNMSQASSCDYSMSQFREDESAFSQKMGADDSQNGYDETTQDPINSSMPEENELENEIKKEEPEPEEDDEDDVPLSKRKAPIVEDDEDDMPLSSRKKIKKVKIEDESDEDIPLASRKKSTAGPASKKKKRAAIDEGDDYDEKPKKKAKAAKTVVKTENENESPQKGGRKKKAEEEPEDVWRWWEEEKRDDSIKWNFLEHKGPYFAPEYEPLPPNVRFFYDGKPMKLSQETEEICCFYGKMLNHDYVTKKVFNDNFFKDWRKVMTQQEKDTIKDLSKCDFKEINQYFTAISEKNKNRSKEEKQKLKEQNEAIVKEYGFCTIDGHKEKIGNFRLEPPGLFRGRGEHPKMGMVKKRIRPEDIIINCSKDSKIPQPPAGHRWKEVRHDNTVTWLASWIENVQGGGKYIMLNPSSKIKGEKDWQKYETARRLIKHIDKIRSTYRDEWKSKEMKIRQRAVALYFIDKLALRAGNEKDEDQADTVGCCSLRVEHVELHKELDGKENVVVFDFLGKDSIRYYNAVPVEKRVFKNLELFKENKKEGDELFDRLNTSILNEHLRDLMEGLTAKVFRTYNASITLQHQLDLLTDPDSSIPEKLLSYNRANRAVAILCNHQRSVPKSHEKSMENLKGKINAKRQMIEEAEAEYRDLKKEAKRGSVKEKIIADKKAKQIEKLQEQLKKLELQETDRDENKTIALGTSKLNYLDPRISVAWCKKHGVPLEKIFNKTQRDKFRWAIHMATEDYHF